jgi:NAD-dependent SIR2 family protein deacetylase
MPPSRIDHDIGRAARRIAEADAIIVAAGAGMGVDSGLPDFRGNEGFWKAYPALANAGVDFTQAASARSFALDPVRAWGFYGQRLALYRRTVPHAGFRLLQNWSREKPHGCNVFTSNVDGQFQLAGFDTGAVSECHGSIHYLQCTAACSDAIWPADDFEAKVDEFQCRLVGAMPSCPACGALARPNILMFDDWDWRDGRSAPQAVRQKESLNKVQRPVVIELGAGVAIPTVRHFSSRVTALHGATLVRINPREPAVQRPSDVGLRMNALDALIAIDAALQTS